MSVTKLSGYSNCTSNVICRSLKEDMCGVLVTFLAESTPASQQPEG